MKRHIWYRLEYKRLVERLARYTCWVGGIAIALIFSSLATEPDSLINDLLIGLGVCGAALIIIGMVIANTLVEVDKHEWELTKTKKEEQTQ